LLPSGQSLRFYCENCETGICASCTDIEHRDHSTVNMSEAVQTEKELLKELIEKAQTQVSACFGSFPENANLLFMANLNMEMGR
jgi:hypothetical protein